MYSLFIDTHIYDIVVILFRNGKIIKKSIIEKARGSELLPCIKELTDLNDINEIIVVNGPGSFTGIRTGITVAKTIAYVKNIPIKTVSYLDLMDYSLNDGYNIVGLFDSSGIFVGYYNKHNLIKKYLYIKKGDLSEFIDKDNIITNVVIDYEKAYKYIKILDNVNPKNVNPLYIKLISVEYDKKSC